MTLGPRSIVRSLRRLIGPIPWRPLPGADPLKRGQRRVSGLSALVRRPPAAGGSGFIVRPKPRDRLVSSARQDVPREVPDCERGDLAQQVDIDVQ